MHHHKAENRPVFLSPWNFLETRGCHKTDTLQTYDDVTEYDAMVYKVPVQISINIYSSKMQHEYSYFGCTEQKYYWQYLIYWMPNL